MPTAALFLPRATFHLTRPRIPCPTSASLSRRLPAYLQLETTAKQRRGRIFVAVASSGSLFDGPDPEHRRRKRSTPGSKKSILLNLIQDIEPLDVTLIQKDVPVNTVDAMKRTISGMLGLLPSDQFHVLVEALWEPLFKLLVSSMKTGYTLRNAEYRLCLERNLDIFEDGSQRENPNTLEDDIHENLTDSSAEMSDFPVNNNISRNPENIGLEVFYDDMNIEGLGDVTPEAQKYILYLQSRLKFSEKELRDIKRKNAALQMQQFVGDEKNDLLDYLRSLQPEKVAELSEPTCPGVEEAIHSVVHGLLATLSPKVQSKPPLPSENATGGTIGLGKDDCAELVENTSIQFQPLISVPRDYLARLLFWCMLLGHYIRGLEYRLELMQLLTISGDIDTTQLLQHNGESNS